MNTPTDAPEKPTEKEMGSLKWDKPGRDLALFSQVAFAGQKAFLTSQANVKADKYGKGGITYNRELVWTNEQDGILTLLKKHEAFATIGTWPPYTSVLNHLDRVLAKYAHLYTPGKEQAEPAAAGDEGTKDERRLTALETAVIEVASLKAAADATTAAHKAGKKVANEHDSKEAQFMQDAACKRRYAEETGEEAGEDEAEDEDEPPFGAEPAGGAKAQKPKQKKQKKAASAKFITVADFCKENPLFNEETILQKKEGPPGYKFFDPADPDETGKEHPCDVPYLQKVGGGGGASGFRQGLLERMDAKHVLAKSKLDLAAREMTLKEKEAKKNDKKDKLMLKMLMKMGEKMFGSDFDGDDSDWCAARCPQP